MTPEKSEDLPEKVVKHQKIRENHHDKRKNRYFSLTLGGYFNPTLTKITEWCKVHIPAVKQLADWLREKLKNV